MAMTAPSGEFDPRFSGNGDVVLQSSDGTKFRLDAAGLKAASSVFRDMLNFPRDPNEATDAPIVLTEDSKTLSFIFSYIYPTPSSTELASYDEIWKVVEAAEKYDMSSVLKILRMYVLSVDKFRNDPVNLYAVASQRGWRDVLCSSSTSSLEKDLSQSRNVAILKKAKPADAFALLELHWKRKEMLREASHLGEEFHYRQGDEYQPGGFICTGCDYPIIGGERSAGETQVETFRSRVRDYIDQSPLAPDLWKKDFWDKKIGGIAIHRCNNCKYNVFNVYEVINRLESLQYGGELPSSINDTINL